jgi:hypothetical protein
MYIEAVPCCSLIICGYVYALRCNRDISLVHVNVHHCFINANLLVHAFKVKTSICIYVRIVYRERIRNRIIRSPLEDIATS